MFVIPSVANLLCASLSHRALCTGTRWRLLFARISFLRGRFMRSFLLTRAQPASKFLVI